MDPGAGCCVEVSSKPPGVQSRDSSFRLGHPSRVGGESGGCGSWAWQPGRRKSLSQCGGKEHVQGTLSVSVSWDVTSEIRA